MMVVHQVWVMMVGNQVKLGKFVDKSMIVNIVCGVSNGLPT